jgi:hypothetical protein
MDGEDFQVDWFSLRAAFQHLDSIRVGRLKLYAELEKGVEIIREKLSDYQDQVILYSHAPFFL